ncbi:MAG: hypothetical protein ABI183_15485, partial [Polyangiaceae bacterium]
QIPSSGRTGGTLPPPNALLATSDPSAETKMEGRVAPTDGALGIPEIPKREQTPFDVDNARAWEPKADKFADIQDTPAEDHEDEEDDNEEGDDFDDGEEGDDEDDDESDDDADDDDDDDDDDEGDDQHGHRGDDFDTTLDTIESTSRPSSVRPPDDQTSPSQFRQQQQRDFNRKLVAFLLVFLGAIAVFALVKWQNGKAHPDTSQPIATSTTPTAAPTPTSSAPALPTFAATDTTAAPTDTASASAGPIATTPPTSTAPIATHTPTVHTAAPVTTETSPVSTDTTSTPPLTIDPNSAAQSVALAGQAQAALEKGQTGLAISLARKATDRDPRNAEAWLILGAAQETAGSHTQARAAYTSCAKRAEGVRVSECRALLE